jgi:hypothetical protein
VVIGVSAELGCGGSAQSLGRQILDRRFIDGHGSLRHRLKRVAGTRNEAETWNTNNARGHAEIWQF